METKENAAFLEWRRAIAQVEEGSVSLAITPFEKNVQVWKQLWRVIEKSDLLLQIVDARNPYFFYSSDLEKYIGEHNKKGEYKQFILLVNKADFLSPDLMAHWNQYFTEKNVNHIFFSALEEQFKIDLETTEEVAEIEPIDEEDIVATGLLAEIEREEAMEAEKERK